MPTVLLENGDSKGADESDKKEDADDDSKSSTSEKSEKSEKAKQPIKKFGLQTEKAKVILAFRYLYLQPLLTLSLNLFSIAACREMKFS